MRVMTAVVAMVLALMSASAGLVAQVLPPGTEGQLVPVAEWDGRHTLAGACGKYVGLSIISKERSWFALVIGRQISFSTVGVNNVDILASVKDIVIEALLTDPHMQIRVISGLKVPTVKILPRDGQIALFELSISPEDFKEAPCLARSKQVSD